MRNSIPHYDRRRLRAERLTAAIMQEVRPILDSGARHDHMKDIHRAVYELLWRTGADIITDADRQAAGLPDRGNTGYTDEELHILELRMQEVMLNPTAITIKSPNQQSI